MKTKELMEKRSTLLAQMEEMSNTIEAEQRAFSEEEEQIFAAYEAEIKAIDRTIESVERSRRLGKVETAEEAAGETEEELEIRSFATYLRTGDSNITKTDNGAVIPKTIAARIIDRVKDISPLFKDATEYNIKGTVAVPYVDSSNDNLTVAYASEFTDLEAKSTKLLSIDLKDYLAGVLAKISLSLINDTDINLVDFVVEKLASAVAVFIDSEILNPSDPSNKIKGLSTVSQKVTAAASTAITADELIKLKDKLKSVYQNGAYFVMAPETLTACRLLKDGNQRYLFNDDITEGFSGTILGKPVYVSDQCPAMEAGKKAIFYIKPAEALAVKVVEESVQILREKYATQHALGVVEWVDLDAQVVNQQAVAVLEMASASA